MKNKTVPEKITRGYKVTDSEMKCLKLQYDLDKIFEHDGDLKICNSGFHFCERANDCFNYYSFSSDNRVFEVKAYGELDTEGDKHCCKKIKFIKELTWLEVLNIVNTGRDNTGRSNTGDRNTGYWNTGDRNTGNWNTGDRNTGDSNTGYSNTGNWNTGNWNTGNWNTGNWNTGDRNTGDRNTGYRNTGNWNTGYSNTGDRNTGDSNTGYRNTGNWNTGNWNTGDRNTGYSNTGNRNTGDRNTGNWNTGNRNTGYSNTGNRNTGAFCTIEPPFTLFNKESNWSEKDFLESDAYRLMRNNVDTKIWVCESIMTEEEKKNFPAYKTASGYVKDIPFKEAFQNAWHNWTTENRKSFTSLPNFDWKVFTEITGVKKNG